MVKTALKNPIKVMLRLESEKKWESENPGKDFKKDFVTKNNKKVIKHTDLSELLHGLTIPMNYSISEPYIWEDKCYVDISLDHKAFKRDLKKVLQDIIVTLEDI